MKLKEEDYEIKAFISEQAIKRFKKDKKIKGWKKKYNSQIAYILSAPLSVPKELLGEFFVSPRGSNPIRVAWHIEIKKETIYVYIDDLLYHEGGPYVDKWDLAVKKQGHKTKIGLKNYSGYASFSEL